MALPDGIITVPIRVGRTGTHTGDPLRLRLRIIPRIGGTPGDLVHVPSQYRLSAVEVPLRIDPGNELTFDLPAVDQPDFIGPDGLPAQEWSYDVELVVEDVKPYEGYIGTLEGTVLPRDPVMVPLQPRQADAPVGILLNEQPAGGWVRPLSPLIPVGPDAPTDGSPLWLDTSSTPYVLRELGAPA